MKNLISCLHSSFELNVLVFILCKLKGLLKNVYSQITLNSYTDEFILKLIDIGKQNSSLWNKRDPKYSNNIAKNKMWNEINAELEPLKCMYVFCQVNFF